MSAQRRAMSRIYRDVACGTICAWLAGIMRRRLWVGAVATLPMMLAAQGAPLVPCPVVFMSRQIPDQGSICWSVPKDQPGVGPHSRFRMAAPGQLVVREINGSLRVLVNDTRCAAEPAGDGAEGLTSGERFGAIVSATRPIAVEHSMYWNTGGTLWASGSNETGIKLP
jgi:hypothetical protein